MFKRAIGAWSTFWIGVVVALIVLATSSWKAALIVFAITLLITIVLVALTARKAYDEVMKESPSNFGRF